MMTDSPETILSVFHIHNLRKKSVIIIQVFFIFCRKYDLKKVTEKSVFLSMFPSL